MNAFDVFPASACAAAALCLAIAAAALPARAADGAAVKPTVKAVKKPTPKSAKKAAPAELPPAPATDEQRSAAEWVHYGEYQCEFKQIVQIAASERFPAYVDLRFANAHYLMKPVLSSTGAIRLEDVRGQTLMIQIANKSMLMNVKVGTRLVDDCVSPRHRTQIEAAKQAAALEAAQTPARPTP